MYREYDFAASGIEGALLNILSIYSPGALQNNLVLNISQPCDGQKEIDFNLCCW